jgi:hypothetical protein
MSPLLIGALAAGAILGLGVWLLLSLVLVPERVSLRDALQLDRSIASAAMREQESLLLTDPTTTARGRLSDLARRVEDRLAGWRLATPDEDLTLIEWSRGRFLLVRVALTLAAVLVGPLFWVLFNLGGAPIGLTVPQGLSVLLGVFVWYAMGVWVTGQAAQRRLEMREALVSYLTVLALFRASGEGMVSAMQQAAAASDAWTYRRIDARLSASLRAGLSPQDGLRQLGRELRITELSDVADIAATASLEGAGVFTTLLARADALRNQMQSDAESTAAAKSVRMGIPKALLVMTGVAFLMYPLIIGIAGA